MDKIFKKKCKGQVTVETAIVMPIVILVVASLIYMALYAHDSTQVKCQMYVNGREEKVKTKLPMFVMNTNIKLDNAVDTVRLTTAIHKNGNTNFINKIIGQSKESEMTIQKTMNTEILYASIVVCEKIKAKGKK